MKYISTRGQSPAQSFSEILLGGLAPDGGLYLPESYPKITVNELNRMRAMDYRDLAFTILEQLATDIPADDLRAIVDKTYTSEIYCHARSGTDIEEITPLLKLEPDLHLLCLSNGPTLAFKDMAMQLLGNLFEYVLGKSGQHINILGATSGDTGSAAEYAMRGKSAVSVFMLSPHNKMSRFQAAQMFSLQDENIHNIAIRGVFDECQDIVKAVFNDHQFKRDHQVAAVNSINWGRIAAQIIYYFKGYLAATESNDQQVSFCVPSGNFGNICAGHIARMMGLPIKHLVVATNENDVLDEFFRTGVYRPRGTENTYQTSSPSMDISRASNFERFVYDLGGQNDAQVNELWQSVDLGGAFDLNVSGLFARVADFGFLSGSSSHSDRIATIRKTWEKYHVVVDTHTADGLKVAQEFREEDVPMLVLETAQPAKFEDAIQEALQLSPDRPDGLEDLESLPQRFQVMDVDIDAIKQLISTQAHRVMRVYSGSCHCGEVAFSFRSQQVDSGMRCNCSICKRKGAVMSNFTLPLKDLTIRDSHHSLTSYQFGENIAKHHFCSHCGIFTFVETRLNPGEVRVNLACIDSIDTFALPTTLFDGESL